MKFKGYRRPDGKIGIRNHVLILPCSLCASETARFIASQVPGAVYIPNQGGCAISAADLEMTFKVLSGFAANPNVYGTVVVGNNCEGVQAHLLVERIKALTNKPLECVVIRDAGGTIKAVELGVKYAMKMSQEADLPAFSALARIYEAQAIGRTGAPETAISQVDTTLYIMESSKPRTRNEKFNALLLYYLALETKAQICHEAGRYKEAYDYSMQHLERLKQEERKGYDDMDLNGFKTERLVVYLKLANICQDSGKDGSLWFEKGMQLYQELEHSERTTCKVADYLFSTGQYERYERIIVPALEEFLKKAPTQPAMHMVWQWTNILSASGRQDELARWT